MGIEIDFLAVGDKGRSGEAIALRYGNLNGPRDEQTVITIDGGTLESGQQLVDLVKLHYKTSTVDIAILSHPDMDHASGMRVVLEQLQVSQVLMHKPWNYSQDVKYAIDDDRTTTTSIREKTQKNLSAAYEIEKEALKKRIKVIEPFSGAKTNDGAFQVLGPSEDYYKGLLPNFGFMPGASVGSRTILGSITETIKWAAETWDKELLTDPDETKLSAENNSSVIFIITIEGNHYLFTGDAGTPALNAALDYATLVGIDWSKLGWMQVPHHGSKRNLGPTFLNRLLGRPPLFSAEPSKLAYISAAKEGEPKHPSKRVTNALRRRGLQVHVTAGTGKRHYRNAPLREGWSPAVPTPFYDQVED